MRSRTAIVSIALILAGCASGSPRLVEMPPRLPAPHLVTLAMFPETLPEPESAQGPDLLSSYTQAAKLYHLLRARFQSLSEWALMSHPDPPPPQDLTGF